MQSREARWRHKVRQKLLQDQAMMLEGRTRKGYSRGWWGKK